jgi:hypothetical protein
LLIVICPFIFFSCDPFNSEGDSSKNNFWAQNFITDAYYKVDARMLAKNNLCEVWAEKSANVSIAAAQEIADEYSKNIYGKMISAFGWTKDGLNTMQYAGMYTGENGKLTILLLDIKDNYKSEGDSYVSGYFDPVNLYSDAEVYYLYKSRSNERVMIYMDTFPSKIGDKYFYGTIAHEMQHLMNFVSSVVFRNNSMDIWINEGLSSAAEWVYAGHNQERIKWYKEDITGYLAKGDNFFLWDNHYDKSKPETGLNILNDYTTVYLFFQWLRLQSDESIYKKINTSSFSDYRAIAAARGKTWTETIEAWHAANYINHPSSEYGYKNDSDLKAIKAHYLKETESTWPLYPGEAVYTYYQSAGQSLPGNSGNIKYLGLKTDGLFTSTSQTGYALLTHNINSSIIGAKENGTITGEMPPSADPGAKSSNLSRHSSNLYGSYPISAEDMLRRRGYRKNE